MKSKEGENVPGSRNRAGGIKAAASFLWPGYRMKVRKGGGAAGQARSARALEGLGLILDPRGSILNYSFKMGKGSSGATQVSAPLPITTRLESHICP